MKKGVPISPGIAVARAYRVDQILARRETGHLDSHALSDEVRRFDEARAAAAAEIEAIAVRVRDQVGEAEAAIFQAHRMLLQDDILIAKVHSSILTRKIDAATALHEALDEYTQIFSQIRNESLKERLSDLRDVIGRVLAHLHKQEERTLENVAEPVVIVAHEILPSQAMLLGRFNVAGILTEVGGPSGHAAILARALGIPAVSGLEEIMGELKDGDLLVVDGREGTVYAHPGPEVEAAYRKLQREYVDIRDRMIANRDQEPVTVDGTRVELLANVNNVADAETASRVGASGVGLYRTEYLFLAHPSVPDEEEQLAVYRDVIARAPGRSVTIRTLDLGGDKHVPYLGEARETNPFMGWRSIRMVSSHPDFFQTQLRAILRAGLDGDVRMLFPMVSTLEEMQQLKQMVHRAKQTLRQRRSAFAEHMPIGVMVEVPAAALCVDALLDEVDFVSIGSNDLIQYIMAADRDNPKVAHLCEPFNPAVLRILYHVIRACVKRNVPVTLCGEMAGRPRCLLPLFGMGLRRFSMSPAFVPSIKELVFATDLETAEDIARRVLRMTRVDQVRAYLTQRTQAICPNVAKLDVSQ